jgi:hypothetical protein
MSQVLTRQAPVSFIARRQPPKPHTRNLRVVSEYG